tara:strand:+ start:2138 stop:2239 length:102 start_codon:yes stop_codon:yes gene_type:complete
MPKPVRGERTAKNKAKKAKKVAMVGGNGKKKNA